MRIGFIAIILGSVAARPSLVHACSPDNCTPDFVAPADRAMVPANAPALFFDPGYGFHPPTPADVALEDGDGHPLGFTATLDEGLAPGATRPYLLVPQAPLSPGANFAVRFPQSCTFEREQPDGGAPLFEHRFTTTSAVPLPIHAGTLSLAEQRAQAISVNSWGGTCDSSIFAATARLEIHLSSELPPWLPLTRFITTVDGKLWSGSGYGVDPAAENRSVAPPLSPIYRNALQIFAGCPPLRTFDDNGLAEGAHHIEIQVHVAGAMSDPAPLLLDIDLECPPPLPIIDGGTPPDSVSMLPGALPSPGCDCAVAGRAPAPSPFLLAFAVLAFAMRRRAGRRTVPAPAPTAKVWAR